MSREGKTRKHTQHTPLTMILNSQLQVSSVLLGSTEAALMGNFTPISRRSAKCAMRTAWLHSGALRAPLCIQGDVMAHFAGRREVGVKFPMRAASADPKNAQHTPVTTVSLEVCARRPLNLSDNNMSSPSSVKRVPPIW